MPVAGGEGSERPGDVASRQAGGDVAVLDDVVVVVVVDEVGAAQGGVDDDARGYEEQGRGAEAEA